MYNQIEDILLNISIVIATVWIVKRFWGSFFEEKQNSILSVSLWIVLILSILVDTFISKISFPMQPGPEIGSISDA